MISERRGAGADNREGDGGACVGGLSDRRDGDDDGVVDGEGGVGAIWGTSDVGGDNIVDVLVELGDFQASVGRGGGADDIDAVFAPLVSDGFGSCDNDGEGGGGSGIDGAA